VLGKLLLLFTVVPAVELYLLITLGQVLGAGPTIAIVLATGMLGAALARREGARVLENWQEATAKAQIPKDGVVSSVLVLVGGVLLVTPGVVTDLCGFLLLLPWSRRMVASVVRKQLEQRFEVARLMSGSEGLLDMPGPGRGGPRGAVIDVDVVEPEDADTHAP